MSITDDIEKVEKAVVTVSRKWHTPNILAFINHEEVGAAMKLSDFVEALAQEIGNPTFLFTNAQLAARMHKAAVDIQEHMKEKTAAVT